MEKRENRWRFTLFAVVAIGVFAVLVLRLFSLQVLYAQDYQAKAENNYTRLVPLPARRGDILDDKGQVLATSKPEFVISVVKFSRPPDDAALELLAKLLADPELTAQAIKARVEEGRSGYQPVEIKRLPWSPEALAVVSRLEERREDLPGIEIREEPMRYYPNGAVAGHLLGFVGKITKDELQAYQDRNYGISDMIGKSGLEKLYEAYQSGNREVGLRGQKGFEHIAVDAKNRVLGELLRIPPLSGNNLGLTLDLDLQRALEDSMDGVIAQVREKNPLAGAGAAVVLDVRTGAILAMASKPDLNPNDFVNGLSPAELAYYNNERLKPYNNRAVQGTYPPGSTFKMITGMAALEAGAVTPDTTITCPGYYWVKPYIKCWDVHGPGINLYRGFALSCNTYFQNAGYLAGIEAIDRVAREFGLGGPTGARDISGEAAGLLPSPEWKKQYYTAYHQDSLTNQLQALEQKYQARTAGAAAGERVALEEEKQREEARIRSQYQIQFDFDTSWQTFDTLNTSIGQGASSYTMLQMANYVATLANGGHQMRPYLVQKIISPQGEVLAEFGPEEVHRVEVSDQTMAEVRYGMLQVTQPGGTAYSSFRDFPPDIKVAGKTGTAQTGLRDAEGHELQHGLFVSFAPYDHPRIAMAIIIEYGESGSGSAAKVAKAVYQQYFGLTSSAR
ncbi:MAG: penicillin-binding protein 2 [Clostridia bacterium]|nr:MAG: penicillin-binding protein 2 [Clostridia bacterium]